MTESEPQNIVTDSLAHRAGLKQRLWQLRVRAGTKCAVGDAVETEDGRALGRVTSVATLDGETFALAYLRRKLDREEQAWEGRQVVVGDTVAKVCSPSSRLPRHVSRSAGYPSLGVRSVL